MWICFFVHQLSKAELQMRYCPVCLPCLPALSALPLLCPYYQLPITTVLSPPAYSNYLVRSLLEYFNNLGDAANVNLDRLNRGHLHYSPT